MPDKKLTDNEIKKVLECCAEVSGCPACCPLKDMAYVGECIQFKSKLALDLINRLQAENERLLQNLQQPQADTVQLVNEENIVHCKECKHLMFSDFEGECSKGYKGIVRPNDSCPFGVREREESK